jgi:Ca-activated chloride channel homolog
LDENFFLLTVQPPKRVKPEQIVPRYYVFVMNVSGLMRRFLLDVSKVLLTRLLGSMKPHETFNMLLFARSSQAFVEISVAANAKNIIRAVKFIDRQGRGGTELLSALDDAFCLPGAEGHARSVLVVTDGFVTVER